MKRLPRIVSPLPLILTIIISLFPIFSTAHITLQDEITITAMPPWGTSGYVEGKTSGVNPQNYSVAVFIFLETAGGWWQKPDFEHPLTAIQGDSTWTTDIDTGGIDPYATRVMAFLVPAGFEPPECGACAVLPDTMFHHPYTVQCRSPGSRTVTFSGHDWVVKMSDESIGRVGPGSNFFSDESDDVWCDEEGLHLTVSEKNGEWRSTEVICDSSFGYGTYVFDIAGKIDSLDQNIVAGFFIWDDCAPFDPLNPNEAFREIDIEFSRWGDPVSDTNAQFVVQPWKTAGNKDSFLVYIPDDLASTHLFSWRENIIQFQSVSGDSMQYWEYTGGDIPSPGKEQVRFNLWLLDNLTPSDGQSAEITIRRFEFIPHTATGIAEPTTEQPLRFSLEQNYPNPFHPETTIRYHLLEPSTVELVIYDTMGRKVRTLVNKSQEENEYTVLWDGKNDEGIDTASGVYFCRLKINEHLLSKKMILLR